jgi:hypothetical protein
VFCKLSKARSEAKLDAIPLQRDELLQNEFCCPACEPRWCDSRRIQNLNEASTPILQPVNWSPQK